MSESPSIQGVIAAAVTPVRQDLSPDYEKVPELLDFLARRGCHGVLLLGTTGEGPSFSSSERIELARWALTARQVQPQLKLLIGTGTPSLEETIFLNRRAFDLGMDGVVVLPPYYYRSVGEEGLFEWFSRVIRQSVPSGATFLVYHIPKLTGISLSFDLLERLREAFPQVALGIKDSTVDPEFARGLGERFGRDLLAFSGTDSLFDLALEHKASGCITAMANLRSPDLRKVWDARQRGQLDQQACTRLERARLIMDHYPPNPPLYKALLARLHGFPSWAVRPPLVAHPAELVERALAEALSQVEGFAE